MTDRIMNDNDSVNWTVSVSSSLFDSEGNVLCCKCGKKAENAIIGKEAFIAQCNDCAYPEVLHVEQFVYRSEDG